MPLVRRSEFREHYFSHCTRGSTGYLNLTTRATVLRERRTICPWMCLKETLQGPRAMVSMALHLDASMLKDLSSI